MYGCRGPRPAMVATRPRRGKACAAEEPEHVRLARREHATETASPATALTGQSSTTRPTMAG
eukprot:8321965-Alexandrium_andersonii.AAC.1